MGYNENQMVDVSPERRHRFFQQHVSNGGSNAGSRYQIDKAVRELCVFTRQDLGSDAAGANFDLISCRNVLIYFDESLQQRIMPIFHNRLNSTGLLFLGMSESTGTSSDLFTVVERKHQIYAKNLTATQPTFSGIPSSDLTVGSRSHLNNLAHRQSSREDLPGGDLQQKVERDLQAANDKILWIEQELQTKHEELKTAKEELQATTEELQTIDAELHYRHAQLERVNHDLTVSGIGAFAPAIASSLENRILHIQQHHTPFYTVEAFQHRQEIIKNNGELNTYHVGAYLGDGLHEGAITSAIRVAETIVNTVETQSLFLSPIPH